MKKHLIICLLLAGSLQAQDPIDQPSTEVVSSTFVTPKFSEFEPIKVASLTPEHRVSDQLLRKGCDELFAENVASILTQFKNLATKEKLKTYKEFMEATKLHSDLGFKLREYEKGVISDIRAVLRTPITKYSACRTRVESNLGYTMQTPGPSQKILLPCETTYAKQVQEVLDTFRGQVSDQKLKEYRDFMVTLKYFEDLAFKINEFEKATRNVTVSRLRLPTREYDTCRDGIIRREMQQRYLRS